MNRDKDINDQLSTRHDHDDYLSPGEDVSPGEAAAPSTIKSGGQGARPVLSKRISDTRILQHMARTLYFTLNTPGERMDREQPLIFFVQERRGRAHRIVIYHADYLLLGHDLPFVGFISGRRQPILSVISAEIERLDRQLVVELASAPGVLSYSSLQLRSGNWYNLAVFGNAEAKTIFHRLDIHTHAAHQVAPLYYDWIRLHHGMIVGTLADSNICLHYTRYITFDEQRTPVVRLIVHRLAEKEEGNEHA